MKLFASVLSVALVPAALLAQSSATTIPATGGDITITAIQHASVQVEQAGKVIQVDPAQGDFAKAKPADVVLVTDIQGDPLNPDSIANGRKDGAPDGQPDAVQNPAAG